MRVDELLRTLLLMHLRSLLAKRLTAVDPVVSGAGLRRGQSA